MTDIVERLRGTLTTALEREAAVEIERLRETLERIVRWAEAYPIDIFHEPSADQYKRAHKLLADNGMTLDAFSASMGRHCLMGVGDIARDALNTTEKGAKP
jgi:hypothetical protein